MTKIIGITGPSNSGKTTFITSFMKRFPENKYGVIKHDPKDKARFDTPGKDSYNFFNEGADTFVLSPKKSTFFLHSEMKISEVLDRFRGYDIVFIEGLKDNPYKKIGIFHKVIKKEYLPFCETIILRDSSSNEMASQKKVFTIKDFSSKEENNFWKNLHQWISDHAENV